MINEDTNWLHGFQQRNSLDTDTHRVKQIMMEQTQPKQETKADIAVRLIENVKGRDKEVVMLKKRIIDALLKDNEEADQIIRQILSKTKGELNAFVAHIRQELNK